jgi:CDP-glycerol glycerophosphotransferase
MTAPTDPTSDRSLGRGEDSSGNRGLGSAEDMPAETGYGRSADPAAERDSGWAEDPTAPVAPDAMAAAQRNVRAGVESGVQADARPGVSAGVEIGAAGAAVPAISVIVIAYNDADRLPRAVRSVLDQTLRGVEVIVVDDASTDATGEVGRRLAAAYPERVRTFRLPVNSGGCSRPRNVGMRHARGAYVMFLDSDDTLPRHACMTLLGAAEETGADLVAGLTVREFVGRGQEVRWFPRVYARSAVYPSIRDHPDQLSDMLATNKLYRREFLEAHRLRFPEGLHYEDMLFIAHAYLAADTIAVVPHRIYNWTVVKDAATKSISNRKDLRQFRDRIEIHRRIDALYREHGVTDLKLRKDTRFLDHDLMIHVRDLGFHDLEYQREFVAAARGYLGELDPRAYEQCHPVKGITAYLLLLGDVPGALAAAAYAPKKFQRARLASPLAERDGRVFFCADHLDTEEGRRILDVTDFGLHERPLAKLSLANRLAALEPEGPMLHLEGDIVNPLGRIPPDAALSATVEFRDRRRPRRSTRVAARARYAGDRIRWTASLDATRTLRPVGFVDPTWDVRVRLTVSERDSGEEIVSTPYTTDPGHRGVAVPIRPRLSRLCADHLESYITENGHLAFVLAGHGRSARLARAAIRRLSGTCGGHRLWRGILSLERAALSWVRRRSTKVRLYNALFTRLPIRSDTIVFESHGGRQYSGNPRYIYEELRRSGVQMQAIWSYRCDRRGFPTGATLVRRHSWAYYLALARAGFWVDNEGFPLELNKRRETRYLQTWRGSPFKLVGFDHPRLKRSDLAAHERARRAVRRADYVLVRSEHDIRTVLGGLRSTAQPIRAGYPRNDPLVTGGDPEELAALRRRLGLDDGRYVVVYAPTFRRDDAGTVMRRFPMPFDLNRFAERYGDTHVLLVRPHHLCSAVVSPELRRAVRNVADVHDVTALLLLADALVTDYSSVMFDYALLDRPMIFHAPDLEDYARREGCYFDLGLHAPGPITRTETELFAALADLEGVRERYSLQRRGFAERFGTYDTGTAAKEVVARLFASGGTG